jgi:PAS domain S-box-containing protein
MNAEKRHSEIARSLFREANDAFFLFDPPSQVVVDVNPAALRLTGLDKQAACSMRLEELFFGTCSEGLHRLVQALGRTGFFHSREGYFLRRRGKDPLPVNLSVSRIHTEPEAIGLVVARDISEFKRAEEARKQVEARYNSLIESTGVVVWQVSPEGALASLSQAFETIVGWPSSDWIGRRMEELVHPDDREVSRDLLARACRGEPVPRFEFRIRGRNGKYLDCETLLVTKMREGHEDRVLGVSRDITEQKRLEQAVEHTERLRRSKEAAEQASRAKSEFLSNVSHEIRTPLTSILGFAELLSEHPFLQVCPSEIREYLDTISENGNFLRALIDDLLDISRIEAGKLRVEREPCELPQLLSEVVESLRVRAEAKQIRLIVEYLEPGLTGIATDQLRLQQILTNLLDNAIKFTERGTVRLEVRTSIQTGSEQTLQFQVSDTGMGMTLEEMSGLFQPFYRVRIGISGAPSGTGLGLAICKRLANRLGGDISVQSTPQVGSTFTLSIPVGLPGDADDSHRARKFRGPFSFKTSTAITQRLNARILLAEDHDANRQAISLRLSRAGAEVVPARNGKEALERVRDASAQGRPFDALIMDMEMPVLDGYEAVRRLRADGFTGPILAVTAYAMNEDREECLAAGCDEHVCKPIEWDRLFLKLGQYLAVESDLPSTG